MKKLFKLISFLVVIVLTFTINGIDAKKVEASTRPIKVLFIGNSKTAYYGCPAKSFEALANNNNKNVEVTICAKGGKSLKYLYNDTDYRKLISMQAYDIVIMQEAIHQYLGESQEKYDEYVYGVNKIASLVRKKNKNVKLFIRQVWLGKEYGNKNEIYGSGQKTRKFYIRKNETRTSEQKVKAYKNTEALANKINARIIYDGWAMGTYNNKYIKIEDALFRDDKFHQSQLGTDLTAAMIYYAVYKEMPTIKSDSFNHSKAVKNIVQSKKEGKNVYYPNSKNDLKLTKDQIKRIKSVITAKYY